MAMLSFVTERQSGSPPPVFSDEQKDPRVELLSRRLKQLMGERKWGIEKLRSAYWKADGSPVDHDGEPQKPRWQTVQYWVEGKLTELPSASTIETLARAFAMSVDELVGLAVGQEPTNAAWRAFRATDEGARLAPEVALEVARGGAFRDREPTLLGYQLALMAYNATRPRSDA